MEDSKIISINIFTKVLESLFFYEENIKIAIALSGGADSTLLAILLSQYAKTKNIKLVALIVDHKLREESGQEANWVAENLKKQGVECVILQRANIKIDTKIQQTARTDRYNLLTQYAKENQIKYLFVAHHLDDQIETYLMREKRGESIIGNSCMSAKTIKNGVFILRPLLVFFKKEIINTLKSRNIQWVEDPSNKNIKYERVRVRNSHINKAEVLENIKAYTKKRIAMEEFFLENAKNLIQIQSDSKIKIFFENLEPHENIFKLWLLRQAIKYLVPNKYPPKINQLKTLLLAMESAFIGRSFLRRTMGHCVFEVKKDGVFITKEDKKSFNAKMAEKKDDTILYIDAKTLLSNIFVYLEREDIL
jgi:tRNA(Ile)-lysidine synthase